jgi:ribonuclease III
VFTHPAWQAADAESYERLEFLGDAVLGMLIAAELYQRHPGADEGRLAKLKAQVVSRRSCAVVARRCGLVEMLTAESERIGHDDAARLAGQERIQAALVEALIGAAYQTLGFDATRRAVVSAFGEQIAWAESEPSDFKTRLQEAAQRQGRSVQYELVGATGPAHDREFTSAVLIDAAEYGRGSGATKKASEQEAARTALAALERSGG